jgi:putative endonuclease
MKSSELTSKNLPPLSTTWFVYLLRCADQSLYCGITTNLEKRLKQHNGDLVGGAKYTKARLPCTLVYFETAFNRSDASKREAVIKKMTKKNKEALVSFMVF